MALLNIIPYNTKINFVRLRGLSFLITACVILATVVSLSTRGINYGIDFLGGYILEVRFHQTPDIGELREKMNALDIGEVSIQTFGDGSDVLLRFEKEEEERQVEGTDTQAIQTVKTALGGGVDFRRIETVGPKVGSDLVNNSLKAVAFALIAMLGYIALRFEWQFAVCAIVALFHDCMAILGLFSIFGLEFKETAIISILITAGYSINDTIVIFDRIRENIKRYRKLSLVELINKSLNETLSRTLLTASTTLLAVCALYMLGGKVIAEFSLPILIGIIIGSFSSICLASPLLLYLNVKRPGDADKDNDALSSKIIEGDAITR